MNKIWIILIIGILIRVCLSFLTYHPDIQALTDSGQYVTSGHIFDLYNFSSDSLVLNYPPLIYWYFGFFNLLTGGSIPLLKLTYLIFDISLAFLLLKSFDQRKGILAFSLWMFNPVNLYATYMLGQFDIMPTFFTFLSVFLAFKNKLYYAALALGCGIAFKLYPVFLIIPLIILGKNYWVKIKLAILSALPYIISVIPYITSSSFRSNALFANQSSKSLYATIPVSGGEAIMLFPAFLLLFYIYIYQKKIQLNFLWRIYTIPLLLFFIFTHYHPQWLIWLTPFVIFDLCLNRFQNILPVCLILLSWFLALFFFDPSLTIGLFSPIIPDLKNAADIWTIFNIKADINYARSILQTVLVASAFYLIYCHLPKKENV